MLFGGMGRLTENSIVVNVKNKSHSVTAEIDVPETGAEGVIIAQGGTYGGWSLYAKDKQPATATTCSGSSASRSTATRRSRATTRCAWSSPTTAAVSPRAAPSRSTSTATKVGEGRVDGTVPMVFSADETSDVGSDTGTSVSDDKLLFGGEHGQIMRSENYQLMKGWGG